MTASPPNNQHRTFKGFVALERTGGAILWGTLRPNAAEARQQFQKWNPTQTPVIVPIRLTLDPVNLTGEGYFL